MTKSAKPGLLEKSIVHLLTNIVMRKKLGGRPVAETAPTASIGFSETERTRMLETFIRENKAEYDHICKTSNNPEELRKRLNNVLNFF